MSSSDRGLIRGLAFLALGVLGVACARGPGAEHLPRPRRLVPSWGLVGEPVPVLIEGENFLALATQHLGGGEPVSVDSRFEAFLGEVPLEEVILEDARTLHARVPARLARGWHTLTLRGPLGRVTLPRAWYVSERTLARLMVSAGLEASAVLVEQGTRLVLTVENTGETAALAVTPVLRLAGEGRVDIISEPGSADIAPLGKASFVWELRGAAPGAVRLSLEVGGREALSGMALEVSSLEVGLLQVRQRSSVPEEVSLLLEDPLGDGASFSQVVRFGGRLYLGPSRDGTGGVSVAPDGSGGQSFRFNFLMDTNGNASKNKSGSSYPSIGVTGCAPDTPACGPDNENGRGLLFSGAVGTEEWLGIGGARSGGDLDYVYLTRDTDAVLDMRYLDLSPFLGSQTKGISSAFFFHNRLYLGFLDTGGSRPYFTVLYSLPTAAPGYDPIPGVDGENLEAQNMPGIGLGGTPQNRALMQMIDALAVFNDRLYVANNGGCVRSTTPTPRSWGRSAADWVSCTPALNAWSARASWETSKTADLEPADGAVPAMAVFQGRLYLARNTMVGPQLFVCNPEMAGSATDCDAGDWSLVAPNSVGDTLLTQFDNPDNVAISLLEATASHLYVGFDNGAQGVVVLRASTATPVNQADFQGTGGCSAEQHPTACAGLGGNGLGVGARRLFDAVTLGTAEGASLYLTSGDGSGPVRLFRLPD